MKTYQIKTHARMKPYNNNNYWIDSKIIPTFTTKAQNVQQALLKYQEYVNATCYINISKTGLKNKQPTYIDTENGAKQVGYCITAATDIENKKQFIDLWCDIIQLIDAF